MSKRAFVVMGPPSSGTRLLTRLLIAAGCAGDGDHHQRFDNVAPTADLIVFRRHFPDGRVPAWAEGRDVFRALRWLGYSVSVVIINRDWHCTIQSQLAAPHAADVVGAYHWLHDTWRKIFHYLPDDMPFYIVSYESLVQRPQVATAALLKQLDLCPLPAMEPIKDGNEKYYVS